MLLTTITLFALRFIISLILHLNESLLQSVNINSNYNTVALFNLYALGFSILIPTISNIGICSPIVVVGGMAMVSGVLSLGLGSKCGIEKNKKVVN
jgi:hypothetical protein